MTENKCSLGYSWCDGADDAVGSHAGMTYVSVDSHRAGPLSVGVGIYYDTSCSDIAPFVSLHINGGSNDYDTEISLWPSEAEQIVNLLLPAIEDATRITLERLPTGLTADLLATAERGEQ
ncbi:hypothetical protein [Mycolicibacterium llatzerense]|uniref:hypothetical protein n=1 Tax=Mycolicibacterium llatzerense TaxID=280871 RepID=UPI0021B6D236|nr:hypothetical protein [Mycolicibacterium llatzerense]MCT7369329.1 hypothetical protein [Mycolicibacterium llatzerense]